MKKAQFLFVICILTQSCNNSESITTYSNRGLESNQVTISNSSPDLSVKNTFSVERGIVAQFYINKKPVTLAIDTGFVDFPMISETAAKRINLHDFLYSENTFLGETKFSGRVEITLGQFTVKQSRIGVVKDRKVWPYVDGFIGFSFLKYFKFTIDPFNNLISLSLRTNPEKDSNPLERRFDGKPRLRVFVKGERYISMIDSGNIGPNTLGRKFDISRYLKQNRNVKFERLENLNAINWNGMEDRVLGKLNLESFEISNSKVLEMPFYLTNHLLGEADMNLGTTFLKSFITTIDYYNWRISFRKIPDR